MMRTSQRQTPPRDVAQFQAPSHKDLDPSPATNMHAGADSKSDVDAGEPPVREKFKKTSLASMPRTGAAPAGADLHNFRDTVMDTKDGHCEQGMQSEKVDTRSESRGRPIRKRSLEELDTVETGQSHNDEVHMESTDGHTRKRSRDVRSGANLKSDSRRMSLEIPLKEVNENLESSAEIADNGTLTKASVETNSPTSEKEVADEEMQESLLSPRKKRSRDQFEAESHREQKIAATNETRARRRSSEEERREAIHTEDNKSQANDHKTGEQNGYVYAAEEASSINQKDSSAAKAVATSAFANSSTKSPFGDLASKAAQILTHPPSTKPATTEPKETSASAFASSGFAARAGATVSPFVIAGTSSTAAVDPTTTSALEKSASPFGTLASSAGQGSGSSVEGPSTSAFARSGLSSFASSSKSGFSAIAGNAFGSGFGSGFGGGSKLSSFAAPKGDLDTSNEKPKPLGSATSDGGDSDRDEDGDDNPEESTEAHEEESNKFHVHETDTGEEGEDTIFQNRGKLYRFVNGNWTERGQGIFKLNVARADEEKFSGEPESSGPRRARFIMRTHATHRVVLNSPIFKEMKVGNIQGDEPTGKKALTFSVPVDGRLELHLVRMGKEDDIMKLWQEVKALQKAM